MQWRAARALTVSGWEAFHHNRQMPSRLLSLLIWAAVAACALYWGLRLFVRPAPVPGGAVVATAPPAATGDLSRLLGAPPLQPVADAVTAPTDSRFKLLGLVAPRAGQSSGLALISVDGKPARALAVGRELEPGLRLLSVSRRQADLGLPGRAPALILALPTLAEANRGRPGDLPGAATAAAVPGLFGQPPRAAGGAVPTPRLPGVAMGGLPPGAMGQGATLPGNPVEVPTENSVPANRQ